MVLSLLLQKFATKEMSLFQCIVIGVLGLGLANGIEEVGKILGDGSREDVGSLGQVGNLKIINGKNASIKHFPYMASLTVNGWYGAGAILNRHWILTTAFNVNWLEPSDVRFRVGSERRDKGGQLLQAKSIVYHENYNGSWDWDIAVVRVQRPIRFSGRVRPIKLASKGGVEGGVKGKVAGWGQTVDQSDFPSITLKSATVTVLQRGVCSQTYGSELTPRLMCSYDRHVGPCVYDYGDPLVIRGVLHGLYAGGVSCTPGENPVLYTDVGALHQWVNDAIRRGDAAELQPIY